MLVPLLDSSSPHLAAVHAVASLTVVELGELLEAEMGSKGVVEPEVPLLAAAVVAAAPVQWARVEEPKVDGKGE